mmetsp:Transcript_33186/g.72504  ORF Transcript_33186/g.72504 Transcript_33186/m.72504 type:complete len:265 (-) Transcript_33186:594-1388(-)
MLPQQLQLTNLAQKLQNSPCDRLHPLDGSLQNFADCTLTTTSTLLSRQRERRSNLLEHPVEESNHPVVAGIHTTHEIRNQGKHTLQLLDHLKPQQRATTSKPSNSQSSTKFGESTHPDQLVARGIPPASQSENGGSWVGKLTQSSHGATEESTAAVFLVSKRNGAQWILVLGLLRQDLLGQVQVLVLLQIEGDDTVKFAVEHLQSRNVNVVLNIFERQPEPSHLALNSREGKLKLDVRRVGVEHKHTVQNVDDLVHHLLANSIF